MKIFFLNLGIMALSLTKRASVSEIVYDNNYDPYEYEYGLPDPHWTTSTKTVTTTKTTKAMDTAEAPFCPIGCQPKPGKKQTREI